MADNNLFPETFLVDKAMRSKLNGHGSALLWFTGLSGCGKSSISRVLEQRLFKYGIKTYILDGDNLRNGLNSDLGFSLDDRKENIRRIGEVGKLFTDAGVLTIASFISPLREDRDWVRGLLGSGNFIEIWVKCPLECCERRDLKGLYRRARVGEITEFTGISSPYERPLQPEITVDSENNSIDQCVNEILNFLSDKGFLPEQMIGEK